MSKTSTKSHWSKAIRAHIVPFAGMPAEKKDQCFTVGWHNQALLFTDITDALKDTIIRDLVYFRKIDRQNIPDLLQQGWLRLWQDLQDDPNLLAERSRLASADYVTNRCGASTLQYRLKHCASYHHISNWNTNADSDVYEDRITDIVIGSSLKSTGHGAHALFTRKLDVYLDIKEAIQTVARWCGDNLKKLAALYYLTTSVSETDAGRLAGLAIQERVGRGDRCGALRHWVKLVKQQLHQVLANYRPIEPNKDYWKECLKAGQFEPMLQLVEKYVADSDKLLALYGLTTCVSRQTLVDELGVKDSPLWYSMKLLRQELRCMYARRVA